MLTMMWLGGCGFLQTYEQAVEVFCDAPEDCAPCDRERQSPGVYHAAIGWHLEQSLWNERGKELVNRVAHETVAKGQLLREEALAVGLERCPYADDLDAFASQVEELGPAPGLGIALPTTESCFPWQRATRVSVGSEAVLIEGVSAGSPGDDPVHPGSLDRLSALVSRSTGFNGSATLQLDVDGQATWSTLRPVLAAAANARFVTVRLNALDRDGRVCQIEALLVGPVYAEATVDPSAPDDALLPGVARVTLGENVPGDATRVELSLGPERTAQELATAVAAIHVPVALVTGEGDSTRGR